MSSNEKPTAVVVDIDGTVASHVLPDGRLLRDHHTYRAAVWDLPKPAVIAVVLALRDAGHQVIFCSGRPERDKHGYDVRAMTRGWLEQHLGDWTADQPLVMRPATDQRPDDIVKRELYERHIAPTYDLQLALDDRDRVVAMWRALGVTCLQVDYGDF